MLISNSRHPSYGVEDYSKFRLAYNGGREYIEEYLQKFSHREDDPDFEIRKELTYNPAFAAEAVDEVKDAISLRMAEIVRTGGTESYNAAVGGADGGVDLQGSSMDYYIGQTILPELLAMGRVGVYVDMPKYDPYNTLAQFQSKPRPYLYHYPIEDILNWQIANENNELTLIAVLLRERHWINNEFGLPSELKEYFRLINRVPEGVRVRIFEQYTNEQTGDPSERVVAEYLLDLDRIPFVIADIKKSLLNDIADYQRALLNLASADLMYAIQANFSFYVEGYDPKTQHIYAKQGPVTTFDVDGNEVQSADTGGGTASKEIKVGTTHGRLYPMEAKPPMFIHPSSEPLRVSMEKQQQLKDEIRRLLNLAVANVAPTRQSADAKKLDQHGLEAGLSRIGTVLETLERKIAELWALYEGESTEDINVGYPTTYSLKSDEQRFKEATELKALKGAAPSKTFNKEVSKLIAKSLLDGRVNQDTMQDVFEEIDEAKYGTSDVEELIKLYEAGITDGETTAEAANFDPSIVQKAQEERTKRMADIAAAQSPGMGAANNAARGVKEGAPTAKIEKQSSEAQNG